jgi:hypothetical protein
VANQVWDWSVELNRLHAGQHSGALPVASRDFY